MILINSFEHSSAKGEAVPDVVGIAQSRRVGRLTALTWSVPVGMQGAKGWLGKGSCMEHREAAGDPHNFQD